MTTLKHNKTTSWGKRISARGEMQIAKLAELLTRAWQYWVGGGPVSERSCGHRCLYSPGCGAQSLRRAQPGESWQCRSWCCGKWTSLPHLLCSPATKKIDRWTDGRTDMMAWMSVQDETNHFPHDASSHVFCSHFFDEILEGLFHIDH